MVKPIGGGVKSGLLPVRRKLRSCYLGRHSMTAALAIAFLRRELDSRHGYMTAIDSTKRPFPETALVAIPPAEVCEAIQPMRVAYDPQGTVVVPHITLLYPFVSRAAIPLVLPCLEEACTSTPMILTAILAAEPHLTIGVDVHATAVQRWRPIEFELKEVTILVRDTGGIYERYWAIPLKTTGID